jgi:hypothetical protein
MAEALFPCNNCGTQIFVLNTKPCPKCGATRCRSCGRRTVKEDKFCMYCGSSKGCPKCGTEIPDEANYCPACGSAKQELKPAPGSTAPRHVQTVPRQEPTVSREDAARFMRGRATRPLAAHRERLQLEVHAREAGMAGGRSIVANLLGQPALLKCKFTAIAFIGGRSREIYEAEFLRYAGQAASIETLGGIDRQNAQDALEEIHRLALRDGWIPVAKGTHWYSYRYEKDSNIK